MRLTVRTRLIAGFGVLVLMMVILTVLGIQRVGFIDHTLSDITDINSVKQRYAINFRGSVHDRAIAIRDIAIARDSAEIQSFEQLVRQLEGFYRDSEARMDRMPSEDITFSQQERDILTHIEAVQAKTLPLINEIITRKHAGENVDDLVLNRARPAFIEWLNTINEFIDYQENANQIATPKARDVAGGFSTLMLILTGCAIAVSFVVGAMIARSLRLSLGGEPYDAANAIRIMADGDLTRPVHSTEAGSMLDSLSHMGDKLSDIVRGIIRSANNLSNEVINVSEGSRKVLAAAQEQSTLTQETASQLDTMRHSIDRVAEIARVTEDNSGLTASYAKQGREIVDDAAQAMQRIAETVNATVQQIKVLDERTKQIGGIVNVISGISEQTNLLALNAAIEAARAGESGRGFAVVADEVRQLAKRTGEATSQIETVIKEVQRETAASVTAMETTQPQVENGQAQALKATELLQDIEAQANDSLRKVQEVAQAASGQVDVVSDITLAMERVAQMSRESIEFMQSNDRAASSLNELARVLKNEVAFFKV